MNHANNINRAIKIIAESATPPADIEALMGELQAVLPDCQLEYFYNDTRKQMGDFNNHIVQVAQTMGDDDYGLLDTLTRKVEQATQENMPPGFEMSIDSDIDDGLGHVDLFLYPRPGTQQ